MFDLSQYRALLAEHDDATIAGMAGCSEEAVAAFRASVAPPAEPTPAAEATPPAEPPAEPPARRGRASRAPAPSQPIEAGVDLAALAASLSDDDAKALLAALRARLEPVEPAAPAAAPTDAPPSAIRIRRRGGLSFRLPDGSRTTLQFRDVVPSAQADLVAHLWAHHRAAVETIPGHQ